MKKALNLLYSLLLFGLLQLGHSQVFATSQQTVLPTTPLLDTSGLPINADYAYQTPPSSTQTLVTPENEGAWYVWALDTSPPSSCPTAVLKSIHIKALNTLSQEGNPDWASIGVAYTGNSGFGMVAPSMPTTSGYTTNGYFFVGRWSIGAETHGQVTPEAAIGIAGDMEDDWDLSSLDLSGISQFYVSVGHDAEDGTQGLQTTLQSIVGTFDTSSCDPQTIPLAPHTGSQNNGAIILVVSGSLILYLAVRFKHRYN